MTMKKTLLLTGCLLIFCCLQAQEVTRGQLMDLHYKARKAEKAGKVQEALDIYKTILAIDANFTEPYLKMANIYAADETNGEAVALAIALYQKYLSLLQPNDENAAVVKNHVKRLQALEHSEQSVNLTDMLHIDAAQAQNVIDTKARPGLNAKTKEEIVQQVEEVSALYDKVQEATGSNNTEMLEQYAEQLFEQADPTSPVVAQTNMMLAEMYGKQGDMQKMQEALIALEENIETSKNLMHYYDSKLKDAIPFEDDICGVWVSSLSTDKDAVPHLVFEVSKNDANHECKILPYCTLAKKYKMYKGKDYRYTPQGFKDPNYVQQDYPYSFSTHFIPDNKQIVFNFGNEKFRKGLNKDIANVATDFVGKVGVELVNSIAKDPTISYHDATVFIMGTQLAVAAVQGLILLSTVSKRTNVLLDANIQQVYAGCIDMELIEITVKETSSGYKKESVDTLNFRLFKLYPEYNVHFTTTDNELFGSTCYTKSEAQSKDEYAEILALKDKGYFNRKNYKNLSDKVTQYCFSKTDEDPNMKVMAFTTLEHFEYGIKGLSMEKIIDKNGTFNGWINQKDKKDGFGIFELYSGYKYVGNFKNDKYSGKGRLTYPNGAVYTGNFTDNTCNGKGLFDYGYNVLENGFKYEGDFVKNKFHGEGTMTTTDGIFFHGTWKNGNFINGNGHFEDGAFDGNWTTIKVDGKEITVPHGKGTYQKSDGTTVNGQWKKGKLISENQKSDKK